MQVFHLAMTGIAIPFTPEQRLALIEVLWDSLEQDDLPVTAAQAAELDRRMATYEQDAANAQPWDAVRKRIERNLP